MYSKYLYITLDRRRPMKNKVIKGWKAAVGGYLPLDWLLAAAVGTMD